MESDSPPTCRSTASRALLAVQHECHLVATRHGMSSAFNWDEDRKTSIRCSCSTAAIKLVYFLPSPRHWRAKAISFTEEGQPE